MEQQGKQYQHVSINVDEFFETNAIEHPHHVRELLKKKDEFQRGIATFKFGLEDLDRQMTLVAGELTVIAARSGRGKTALGMQIAYNVTDQIIATEPEGKVLIFSAEMEGWALVAREVCKRAGIPYDKVRRGSLTEEEDKRIQEEMDKLNKHIGDTIFIDQSPAPTLEHMTTQLKAVSEVGPVRLVVFDYTELAGEFERSESQRVRKISRGLKAIAKKFECPVLAISQLNREIERRANKRPNMSDLMNGGEQDPDNIIALAFEDDEEEVGSDLRQINAFILKSRHGIVGRRIPLGFIGEEMRFVCIDIERVELDPESDVRKGDYEDYFN